MSEYYFVTPAKAGVQIASKSRNFWIPAFAGMTSFTRIELIKTYVGFYRSRGLVAMPVT